MSNLFHIQTNDSVRQEDDGLNYFTNLSTTQHQQISQTIFWCANNHTTRDDDDMNTEIIDISDDDEEEEGENTCKNGTSIDDSNDEEEIEVIQLSDDDEEEEVNDENTNQSESTLNNHEINELSMNEPLDLTNKAMLQQQQLESTDFNQPIASTTQTEPDSVRVPVKILNTLGLYCSECSELIDNRCNLELHLMREHDKLLFRCIVRGCNGQFTKRSELSKHYANHLKNQRKLICPEVDCEFKRSNQQSLICHVSLYHEKGLFQCAVCLVEYSHRMDVYKHYNKTHKPPRRSRAPKHFSCPVHLCEFVARTTVELRQHQFTHST